MKTIQLTISRYFRIFFMAFVVGALLIFTFSVPAIYAAESPNILVGGDMTVGSRGQGVVVLQGLLSELGYLIVPQGVSFGYFGPMTKSAVSKYQLALGVSPTAGYFGPVTKTAMRQQFQSRGWLTWLGW